MEVAPRRRTLCARYLAFDRLAATLGLNQRVLDRNVQVDRLGDLQFNG